MSMYVQSVSPPTVHGAVRAHARPTAVVQTPPVSTQTDSSSQNNSPQVPSPNTAPQGVQMVNQSVTAIPPSTQALSAPQQPVQSSISSSGNSVQSPLGLFSFAAITDPQHTFDEGKEANG